jgi:hypothetical protein
MEETEANLIFMRLYRMGQKIMNRAYYDRTCDCSTALLGVTFFGRVPEIFGTLPIRILGMDKGNGFHSILVEILRWTSTGLISWLFNTIDNQRTTITADIVLLGLMPYCTSPMPLL